jgi:branched-chain amino acid transport system substrate-binding protein
MNLNQALQRGMIMKRSYRCRTSHSAIGKFTAFVGFAAIWGMSAEVRAADAYMPIIMPITGFMSVEGGSQRNGALMAVEGAPSGLKVESPVFDTGTSATGAASALDKALSTKPALAASTSIFGTEMVAMLPVSLEYKVPLLTISGLSRLTESGNPYIFRFLPNDREIKVAHARYVVEKLKKAKVALIGDTTAYGQGGFKLLQEYFGKLKVTPVLAESVEPVTKDMSSLLSKVKDSGADVLVVHTVAAPMALFIKQARAAGIDLPVVTSSSLVEPTSTALFDPIELKNTCAETPSAPEARANPEIKAWADTYKTRFGLEPDGLALGQYDGVMMALSLISKGATTPAALIQALNAGTNKGVAMTYKSNGKGDMAHDADIVCWDGTSRIPKVVAHYAGAELLLP